MLQARKLWRRALGGLVPLSAMALLTIATGCIGSTGEPCISAEDCLQGDACLSEDEGFPGGYCTTENCDDSGCLDISSECFRVAINGSNRNVCLANCTASGDCVREGYGCFEVDSSPVCLPEEGIGEQFPQSGTVGSSCTNDSQCGGDLECLTHLDGGYCSALCDSDSDCPSSSHCEQVGAEGFCYRDCTNNSQCRAGYTCSSADLSEASCVPEEGRVTINPDGRDDGQTCNTDIQCKGGVCAKDAEGYPGGYCTTLNCGNNNECNGGICINASSPSCKSACTSDSGCRDGYTCINDTYCEPENRGSTSAPGGGGAVGAFEIQCQSGSNITFTIPDGSVGFYIAPFTMDGSSIDPKRLRGPDGIDLNLKTEYDFYTLNPQLLVSIAPLLFPGTNIASLEGARDDWGGSFTLENTTSADEVCYYVISKTAEGTTLDVNFYLVGVPGVNTSNPTSNSNIAKMLQTMRDIYGEANINVGQVRWKTLSSANTSQYKVIRDFTDVFRLVALSEDPGPTPDDRLSVNVFLIDEFDIPEISGTLLGISPGLPGISGFHGTEGAGLIFSSINLNDGGDDLGQTMAHEIGHFLGLRHTSEHGGGGDPITDTQECSDPEKSTACPDHKNFMFPFSIPGVTQEQISAGQGRVLRRSALVK